MTDDLMIKIEILCKFQHYGRTYFPEEICFVSPNTAEYFCKAGWAKDLTGTYETKTPDKSETVLFVEDVNQTQTQTNGVVS